MSASLSHEWIHHRIDYALQRAYEQIDGYQRDGYCTEADVIEALAAGWGDGVLEGWREYVEGDES